MTSVREGRPALGDGGFSLIEAIVSLVILGVMIMAILPSFAANLRTNTGNELRTGAIAVAQQELDGLRSETVWPATGVVRDVDAGNTIYQARLEHEPYCEGGNCYDGARRVTVEVRHAGRALYRVETIFTSLDGSGG